MDAFDTIPTDAVATPETYNRLVRYLERMCHPRGEQFDQSGAHYLNAFKLSRAKWYYGLILQTAGIETTFTSFNGQYDGQIDIASRGAVREIPNTGYVRRVVCDDGDPGQTNFSVYVNIVDSSGAIVRNLAQFYPPGESGNLSEPVAAGELIVAHVYLGAGITNLNWLVQVDMFHNLVLRP